MPPGGGPTQQIGAYRIEDDRPLGEGAYGVVLPAHDTRLNRPVAVKRIRPELLARRDVRARFLREARLAASIVNPFVATVFDVLEANGDTYLVMESVEGRTLAEAAQDPSAGMDQRLAWCEDPRSRCTATTKKSAASRSTGAHTARDPGRLTGGTET